MKRVLNLNGFFPFERTQFEDYLNGMARKGYHLKKFNGYLSTYEKDESEIYYHVAIHDKNSIFIQPEVDEKYVQLFEESGYQYIDRYSIFYIFASQNARAIYTDENVDKELIYRYSKQSLLKQFLIIPILLCFMYLFDCFSPSFYDFVTISSFIGSFFFVIYWVVLGLNTGYYISYFILNKANYHYHICLLRSYILQFLFFLVVFGTLLFSDETMYLVCLYILFCPCLALVIYFIKRKKENPFLLQGLSLFTYGIGFAFILFSLGSAWMTTYTPPQLPNVAMKFTLNDEEHSLFLDYYAYEIGEYDFLDYAKSLKSGMSDYLLQKFLEETDDIYVKSQQQGYDIYQSDDLVVIYKNNQMIKTKLTVIKNMSLFLDELNW